MIVRKGLGKGSLHNSSEVLFQEDGGTSRMLRTSPSSPLPHLAMLGPGKDRKMLRRTVPVADRRPDMDGEYDQA